MIPPGAGPSTPAMPRTTGWCPRPSSSRGTPMTPGRGRGRPAHRDAAHRPRRRHLDRRQRGRPRGRARLLPAPEPHPRHRPEARTARVEPGVVLAACRRRPAAPAALRARPVHRSRATLGGMIGNNACGAHALAYGRTADNVVELDVIDGTGRRFTAGRGPGPGARPGRAGRREPGAPAHRVRPAAPPGLGLLPRAPAARARRRPGPGAGRHRGHAGHRARRHGPAGPRAAGAALVVLGYPDVVGAADAVPALLAHRRWPWRASTPGWSTWCAARRARRRVPALPAGAAWLMVEVGGDTGRGGRAGRGAWSRPPGAVARWCCRPARQATALWRIREDGAGLAGRTPAGQPGLAGLGGRGRPARAARRLPARVPRPARRLRAGRPALRALRRRLHPRPDRLPARPPGRRRLLRRS